MQKSINSAAPAGKSRLVYLEYLRAAATIAVVFLHVAVTLNANSTPQELGVGHYSFFSACHMLVTWAVPCFVMISGTLLLNPERSVDYTKIVKYIFRMLAVLMSFGVVYALMELVFDEKDLSIMMIGRALLNTLSEKSWSHLWYVYMLISLYLVTIPLRCYIQMVSKKVLWGGILILIAGNFIIPSINAVFNLELVNFMILNQFVCYYLLGYYFTVADWNLKGTGAVALFCTGIMVALEVLSLTNQGIEFPMNHSTGSILVLIQSCSVFLFVKQRCKSKQKVKGFLWLICDTSFGIYLIHPFFINLLYKVLNITPLCVPNFPGLGVAVLTVIVMILSVIATLVLKKIPFVKKSSE